MKAHQASSRSAESPDAREAISYAELLKIAHEEGLRSIQTEILAQPSDQNGDRCIVKATAETEKGHFEGIGDADPGNVEEFLVPHLIRVAETRAKARALRDAVNVGVVSLEELDGVSPVRGSRPRSGANRAPASRSRPRGFARVRSSGTAADSDSPMSESQRRYLFRLLAGQGYEGAEAEDYLRERLDVPQLSQATRAAASDLIDELLQSSAPQRGGGNGAAHAQR